MKMTDFGSKQEIDSSNGGEDTKPTTTATASWSRMKDPRIVRVSRAFGGKDRHSKVCTVRGLRDRRVRLSVPTAIQLYDLQERLGLNQPSKVVDWLLHAAKQEIDELPPLQIPPGLMLNGKFKERNDQQSWMRDDEEGEGRHDHQFALDENQAGNSYASTSNFLPRQQNQNHLSFSSLMSSSSNSYGRWDPSSLTLSSHAAPISLGMTAHHQHQDLHNLSLVYQSGMITQPYFTPTTNAAFDHPTPTARPFSFNTAADRHPSQSNASNQQSKRDQLHSS